ncbi:propionyl-CoA synthetase [Flavisolibacter tropicus]|uniref:Propionyl-CoA synthetase n=1 Tax=Flavisolibacter tropicus TaxID=1492898 RepID=A0A172TTR1_9BACT|nr:propionyl-CoA synthetase [Flavisolibacter tropicus]ANE50376.1 propionyl-CoA synthetase [Flavisolibacter tropicus]
MNYKEFYQYSIEEKEKFWAEQARLLKWFKEPTTILNKDEKGFYHWFVNGKMNTCYLCLDYQIEQGRGEQAALIYDSPVTGVIKSYTYTELKNAVAQFAGGLHSLGITKGDTVVIYMPVIPEAAIAMLACARIGAIHSVVFGGFAPHELSIRIDDAQPKAVISASYGIEVDKVIPYKPLVDEAINLSQHKPAYKIFFQRQPDYDKLNGNDELDFLIVQKKGTPVDCVPLLSTDPLYIIYTSGTTGKPKGVIRDNGGYATALKFSMIYFYNINPGDVFWAASDIGWTVGHSYLIYGPLLHGCTSVMYEGKPVKTPDAGAFWRVIEQHKVRSLFTAPTAIRAIKKEDPEGKLLKKYDLSYFDTLFLAGERCDPPTYHWINDLLQRPVIDHWWQTESGWPMLGIMTGVEPLPPKAGSAGLPVCGYDVEIFSEDGQLLEENKEGAVVVKLPLPPGCLPTLWKNDERFRKGYLERFPGYYLTGDGGHKDSDGYFYIMGRIDDVINVSGHRLSTGAMEELVAMHNDVAECAVVGIADELRGQRPVALVLLKDGAVIEEEKLETELIGLIKKKIGALACFKNAAIVKRLPKTRSGKILRKIICHIADGVEYATPSTIDDPLILSEIAEKLRARKIGLAFQ